MATSLIINIGLLSWFHQDILFTPFVVAVNGSMKVQTPQPTPHQTTKKAAMSCCTYKQK